MRSAALWLVLALPVLALDVRVLDMNEEVTTGTAIAVEGDDLVVTLANGEQKSIPCDTVVEITFPANDAAPAGNPQVEVVLTNGDVIRGEVAGGNTENIVIAAGEMGRMELPLTNVSRVLVLIDNNKEKVPSDASAEEMDRIYLKNQDTNVGFPSSEGEAITAEGIRFTGRGDTEVTYEWKDIAGWYMGSSLPVVMPENLLATAVCSGGTRLTGTLTSMTGTTLHLDHVIVKDVPVPVAAVRAIYFVHGRVAYLSDLPTSAVRERPFIYDPERPENSPFPFRRDGAVVQGGPLTIKTREFRKGLGVHSYSALEFKPAGAYSRFCASVGLDKEAVGADGGGGSVVFQVLQGTIDQLDPELRLYTPHVTDWKDLCTGLAKSKRFSGLFDEGAQKVIAELAAGEEATDARKVAVRNAVNVALAKADLWDEDAFPEDSLPADAKAILAKDAAARTPREVDRLNRRCLEAAAGGAIAHVPAPPNVLYDSGLMRFGEDAKDVSVSLEGVDTLVLVVRCGLEGDIFDGETLDRADWGGARFIR